MKCKNCKEEFVKKLPLQSVCSQACAIAIVRKNSALKQVKSEKTAKKSHREALEKLRTRGYYVNAAQAAFNKFIRLRDDAQPCICCGQHRNGYDAGHYLARSIRPELRYNEDNVHKQAKFCNNYNKGRAAATFRTGMIARIGLERVLALEAPHPPAKWSIEDLKDIKKLYVAKYKQLLVERDQ